jgi:hypothetical protein
MIEKKARMWLPRCVPDGYEYDCVETNHERSGGGGDDDDDRGGGGGGGGGDASYSIFIAPRTRRGGKEGDDDDDDGAGGARGREDGLATTKEDSGGHHRATGDTLALTLASSSSSSSSPSPSTSDYHLIGHDLRSSPDALLRKLSHPNHGFDVSSSSSSTLFVLECVLMYLPETSARDLLRCIAAIPTSLPPPPSSSSFSSSSFSSSSFSSFVAVVIYDPIPGHDRFGQLMIENLKRAGIVAGGGGGGGVVGQRRHADEGGDEGEEDDRHHRHLLGLEGTRTLTDQLSRLVRDSGFDVAVGCDMSDAYDHGFVRREDRTRAMRSEALDELEEFDLLMRHYSLLVGVSSSGSSSTRRGGESRPDRTASGSSPARSDGGGDGGGGSEVGLRLCSVGTDSPMGFREGRCTVMKAIHMTRDVG